MRSNLLKKSLKLLFLSLLLATTHACSKAEEAQERESVAVESLSETNKTLSELPAEVLAYYGNIKTMMYATNGFEAPKLINTQALLLSTAVEEREKMISTINPLALKMQSLQIEDADTGSSVDFFSLPLEEKEDFVEAFLIEEAKMLAEKLEIAPSLKEIIAKENEIFSKEMTKHNLELLKLGEEADLERYLSENEALEPATVFPELRKKAEEEAQMTNAAGLGGTLRKHKVEAQRVKTMWDRYARPGDFFLALPQHSNPYRLVNFGEEFVVGHAGILGKHVSTIKNNTEQITIEAASKEGVHGRTFEQWRAPHYIMGIQRITWKWKWRGFRSGMYKQVSKVDPAPLAREASKYVGHEYVKWYEFATAKWVAPKRFTCTTLVWWCAKEAYGINVSSWMSPLVTPSGLFTDSCTYVKAQVL